MANAFLCVGLLALLVFTGHTSGRAVQSQDYVSTEQSEEQEVVDELHSFLPVRDPSSSDTSSDSLSSSEDASTESAVTVDVCATIFCGNGRKCVLENGRPTCGCALECPDHYKPICGTDGVTYGNPCELHRAACLQNVKIHKHMHGPCPGPPPTPEPKIDETKPLVCYEIERDQLRQLLIDWMKGRVHDDIVQKPERSYAHVLTDNFRDCDLDGDDQLSGSEFIQCVEKNETIAQFTGERPEHGHVLRGLCVDALILMSDTNENWMLDLEEFLRCMDPNFEPPRKQCSLENKLYKDGAETRVDCNICVCACGNWVCSAMSCDEFEDYNLFEPYDVEQGPLPSKAERYALLRGFMAAEHINLDRVEEEVPVEQYENHHHATRQGDYDESLPYPSNEEHYGGYDAHVEEEDKEEDGLLGNNPVISNHQRSHPNVHSATPMDIPDAIPRRVDEGGLVPVFDVSDDLWPEESEEDEDYSDGRSMPDLLTPGAKQIVAGGSPLRVPPTGHEGLDGEEELEEFLSSPVALGEIPHKQETADDPALKIMPQIFPRITERLHQPVRPKENHHQHVISEEHHNQHVRSGEHHPHGHSEVHHNSHVRSQENHHQIPRTEERQHHQHVRPKEHQHLTLEEHPSELSTPEEVHTVLEESPATQTQAAHHHRRKESTAETVTQTPSVVPAPLRRFIPIVSFNMTVVEHRVIHASDAHDSDEISITAERISEGPSHVPGSHHGNHHQHHNRRNHNKHHDSQENHRSPGHHRDSHQPEQAIDENA